MNTTKKLINWIKSKTIQITSINIKKVDFFFNKLFLIFFTFQNRNKMIEMKKLFLITIILAFDLKQRTEAFSLQSFLNNPLSVLDIFKPK